MKMTIDLDAELYGAIELEAARTGRSPSEIIKDALEGWFEAAESTEDRASADAALAEYRRDGGTSAEAFFGSAAT